MSILVYSNVIDGVLHPVRAEPVAARALQRTSLRGAAYEELRRRVLSLELPPGEQLVPEELAAELRVSRTPVREALSLLARDHLVDMAPNGTTWVARPSEAYLSAVVDARKALEGWAAAEAAEKIAPHDVVKLQEQSAWAASILRRTGDAGPLAVADEALHAKILETCGNPVLAKMLAPLADYRIWLRQLGLRQGDHVAGNLDEHRAILEALRARDRDASRAAMEAHIEAGKRRQFVVLAAMKTRELAARSPASDVVAVSAE